MWDLGDVLSALLVERCMEGFGFADCVVLVVCSLMHSEGIWHTDLQLNVFKLGLEDAELLEACHEHLFRLHLHFRHVGAIRLYVCLAKIRSVYDQFGF